MRKSTLQLSAVTGVLLALSFTAMVAIAEDTKPDVTESKAVIKSNKEKNTPAHINSKDNQTQAADTTQDTSATKDPINADERFIPTEEISEDLPVSFPVDI